MMKTNRYRTLTQTLTMALLTDNSIQIQSGKDQPVR